MSSNIYAFKDLQEFGCENVTFFSRETATLKRKSCRGNRVSTFQIAGASPLSRHLVGPITRNLMENVETATRREWNSDISYLRWSNMFAIRLHVDGMRSQLYSLPFVLKRHFCRSRQSSWLNISAFISVSVQCERLCFHVALVLWKLWQGFTLIKLILVYINITSLFTLSYYVI